MEAGGVHVDEREPLLAHLDGPEYKDKFLKLDTPADCPGCC